MNVDPFFWVFLVFASLFTNVGLMFYFMYTKLEKVEALLHDVRFICWYKTFFGTGPVGRQARLNAISMVVMMPGVMQRRGEVSREAYLRLPASLKTQIRALYIFLFANCLAMILLYFFVY